MAALSGQLDHPFGFDPRGRSRRTTADDHVRDLIEQVLFTVPGERLNRPEFGTPLNRLVFEGASEPVRAATEQMVHGALIRWLDPVLRVERVAVEVADARLTVTVVYQRLGEEERRAETFERTIGG